MQESNEHKVPEGIKGATYIRAALQTVGGAIPIAGGLISAAAGAWSEGDQEKVNKFFEHWIHMLEDELKEKEQTVIEIMERLDLHDEKIAERVESKEFKSLMRKTFRDWGAVESEEKRTYIRNVLCNAASTNLNSDDVIRLFIDWITKFSEMHLQVIAAIYNSSGITRAEIWSKIGKGPVREDSADADLFKLLLSDLSIGRVVRQHREKDSDGNFLTKTPTRRYAQRPGLQRTMKSAFDDEEQYELTELGQQFVHYAMTEVSIKIEFKNSSEQRI
jgi:hypothetical protein